ncbi:hypothetical protein EPR50_G00012410 [Perca flavescens]|uniref:Uncharacterized protein n=1 Tax=Perca flavescens TaxID=8167 RepID=A0A484DL97_PERFV|nr:hypothetical protein EPR50_G00012410 [Perca flavescens]
MRTGWQEQQPASLSKRETAAEDRAAPFVLLLGLSANHSEQVEDQWSPRQPYSEDLRLQPGSFQSSICPADGMPISITPERESLNGALDLPLCFLSATLLASPSTPGLL